MNKQEAIKLLKEAVSLLQCDYDSRLKLIAAIQTVERLEEPKGPPELKEV